MNLSRKLAACVLGWVASLFVYIILLLFSSRIVDGVLFFNSCIISIIAAFCSLLVWKFIGGGEKKKETFEYVLVYICCLLLLIIFTIFGPTFIDRSVSYHMVFYASQKGELNISDMEEVYLSDMLEKRVTDELEAEMIYKLENGYYAPTIKAKIATAVLMPIGKLTNTLDFYYDFQKKMDEMGEKNNAIN